MAVVQYRGRRVLSALVCLYMVILSGFATILPSESDDSDVEVIPLKGLDFYAGDEFFYGRIKGLATIAKDVEGIYADLSAVSLALLASDAPQATKDAEQAEAGQIMNDFISLCRDAKEYIEIGKMFDRYRELMDEFNRGGATQGRSDELRSAVSALEGQFEGKQSLVINATSHLLQDFDSRIIKATNFIQKHKAELDAYLKIENHAKPEDMPSFEDLSASKSPKEDSHSTERSEGGVTDDANGTTTPSPDDSGKTKTGDEKPAASTEKHTNDVPEGNPAGARMERIRAYLTDRSLFHQLDILRNFSTEVNNVIQGITQSGANHAAVVEKVLSVVPQCGGSADIGFEAVSEHLAKIDIAWTIYKRYSDISDTLPTIEPDSTEARELLDEQQRLESIFEEYEPLVSREVLTAAALNESTLAGILKSVEEMAHGATSPRSGAEEVDTPAPEKSLKEGDAPTTEDADAADGTVANKMRDTGNSESSSGLASMGTRAIKATVALYMMATL